MKTERNILIAFVLNFLFSVFEFFGGVLTGSVAIVSDAVHDLGDATSIGISYFLEKKSKQKPDEKYTYGYVRYSVVGSFITTSILIFGSLYVIINAVVRIIDPVKIDYSGMILFAIVGVIVNLVAAFVTHKGESLNQKAVNLHMLEDVLGWIVVLIGAVIMKFTNISIIDPIMSIAVATFILINALANLKKIGELFLEKTPSDIDTNEVRKNILETEGVIDVHHIHIWSLDGHNNYATMHIVASGDLHETKEEIRHILSHFGINHVTLELEAENEHCSESECDIELKPHTHHHHH